VDSEVLLSQLRAGQVEADHQSAKGDAGVVIVNTCGFIETAKQESIDTILHYVDEKAAGKIEKLYVTGCLSHRYREELEKEIPQVDAYFGTLELPAILKTLGTDYKHELIGERITTTPRHYAYLKISEGCDRPCSFCAIPLMRGGHVSKPIVDLVKEASFLATQGTKELMLIAQDSTSYGHDIYGKRSLPELLTALSGVEGIDWIRLHYAFPSQFPMQVLEVMNSHSNICKYLDMPLQHITDHMLKMMRRGISEVRTKQLVEKIRQTVPGITLRTTLMVGHPGETEKDFDQLCNFVREAKFERLGVFTYSHEENTHAYTLKDEIPNHEKEQRAAEIMAIQEEISLMHNQRQVGKTLKVLFDRVESGYFVGRTEGDSPEVDNEVLVKTENQYVRIGDFAQVQITSCREFDLFGEVAGSGKMV
jgi:ribosomal protein S12 methylthiotransferase